MKIDFAENPIFKEIINNQAFRFEITANGRGGVIKIIIVKNNFIELQK